MLNWLKKKKVVEPTPEFYVVKDYIIPTNVGLMIFDDYSEFRRTIKDFTNDYKLIVDKDENMYLIMADTVLMYERNGTNNNKLIG